MPDTGLKAPHQKYKRRPLFFAVVKIAPLTLCREWIWLYISADGDGGGAIPTKKGLILGFFKYSVYCLRYVSRRVEIYRQHCWFFSNSFGNISEKNSYNMNTFPTLLTIIQMFVNFPHHISFNFGLIGYRRTMDEGSERDKTWGRGGLPTLPGLYHSTIQPSRRGFF
jgi:hypothetical protein